MHSRYPALGYKVAVTGSLHAIAPVLRDRRDTVLARIKEHGVALQEDFAALIVLDYQRSFDECVQLVAQALYRAG